jgi:hypothetical protein
VARYIGSPQYGPPPTGIRECEIRGVFGSIGLRIDCGDTSPNLRCAGPDNNRGRRAVALFSVCSQQQGCMVLA